MHKLFLPVLLLSICQISQALPGAAETLQAGVAHSEFLPAVPALHARVAVPTHYHKDTLNAGAQQNGGAANLNAGEAQSATLQTTPLLPAQATIEKPAVRPTPTPPPAVPPTLEKPVIEWFPLPMGMAGIWSKRGDLTTSVTDLRTGMSQALNEWTDNELTVTWGHQTDKHLVMQLQYKAFGTTNGQPKTSCPADLRGSAKPGGGYYNGTYISVTGAIDPVLWDPAVSARMRNLYKALAQYLNSNKDVQALEAICLPETAVSQSLKEMTNVMPYTTNGYLTYLSNNFRELSYDLPHTIVIQYTNFGVGTDIVAPLVQLEKTYGIGLGGPDLDPSGHPGILAPRGVYQQYLNLAGDQNHPNPIPFGVAVQPQDTVLPPEQTYLFGRDYLHLNYIFWLNKPGFIDQVNRVLTDPTVVRQSDVAGGLDGRYPSSTSPYLN